MAGVFINGVYMPDFVGNQIQAERGRQSIFSNNLKNQMLGVEAADYPEKVAQLRQERGNVLRGQDQTYNQNEQEFPLRLSVLKNTAKVSDAKTPVDIAMAESQGRLIQPLEQSSLATATYNQALAQNNLTNLPRKSQLEMKALEHADTMGGLSEERQRIYNQQGQALVDMAGYKEAVAAMDMIEKLIPTAGDSTQLKKMLTDISSQFPKMGNIMKPFIDQVPSDPKEYQDYKEEMMFNASNLRKSLGGNELYRLQALRENLPPGDPRIQEIEDRINYITGVNRGTRKDGFEVDFEQYNKGVQSGLIDKDKMKFEDFRKWKSDENNKYSSNKDLQQEKGNPYDPSYFLATTPQAFEKKLSDAKSVNDLDGEIEYLYAMQTKNPNNAEINNKIQTFNAILNQKRNQLEKNPNVPQVSIPQESEPNKNIPFDQKFQYNNPAVPAIQNNNSDSSARNSISVDDAASEIIKQYSNDKIVGGDTIRGIVGIAKNNLRKAGKLNSKNLNEEVQRMIEEKIKSYNLWWGDNKQSNGKKPAITGYNTFANTK